MNRLLRRSNGYTGRKAIRYGWIRILSGLGLIIYSIYFAITGPSQPG